MSSRLRGRCRRRRRRATWYVVAQGKAFHEDVLAHRDALPEHRGPEGRGLCGMISDVYWERFDEEVMEAEEREPWAP